MKAEEFYRKQKEKGNTENITGNPEPDYMESFYQGIFNLMEGFAEYHVEKALGKAADDVFYRTQRDNYRNIIGVDINKDSILNAYPPENIK